MIRKEQGGGWSLSQEAGEGGVRVTGPGHSHKLTGTAVAGQQDPLVRRVTWRPGFMKTAKATDSAVLFLVGKGSFWF